MCNVQSQVKCQTVTTSSCSCENSAEDTSVDHRTSSFDDYDMYTTLDHS